MNLILQHWDGEPTAVEEGSWKSIEAYAKLVGAEHRVLRGRFYEGVQMPHMNKLYMLDKSFDQYDVVVMLDSDMFAREGAANIFEEAGIGVTGALQEKLKASIRSRVPLRFRHLNSGDYYGGAIYRLSRTDRLALRTHFGIRVIRDFDSYQKGCDEGVMHYLASKANFMGRGLKGGELWACSSYSPDRDKAHFVHVRRRVELGSEVRQTKTVALRELQQAGVL